MTPFFRRIRKQLADNNKPIQYLRYAIGEIVLVVIGILIALQINTWNEEKNDRTYELKMLSEVKNSLKGDIEYFEWMIDRTNRVDSMVSVISEQIINKSFFVDSLYLNEKKDWIGLRDGTFFRYNSGPYEAIKSSGIDKISNDSLRVNLIEFYDYFYPLFREIVIRDDRDYDSQMKTLKSFSFHTSVSKNKDDYQYTREYPKDLFQNQDFITLIGEIQNRAKITSEYYKYPIPEIQDLIVQIDNELKK